jgi:undecaprenyl-diphosphatase
VTDVVSLLERLPPLVVLVVAFILVMGETAVLVGLFFPVEVTLLFVGFLAYLGEVPVAPAFVAMIAAALLGDALALRSGRKYGPRVRASRIGARIGPERWARADEILHRLGGRSAFIARWLPFVRTLLPRLAGSAGMPYRRFAPWNAAGVVTDVGVSVLVGYLAGASYALVAELLGRATTAVLLLLAGVVAIVLVGRWLGRHPHPVTALAARVAAAPPLRWLHRRYGALVGALAARVGAGWALTLNLLAGLALLFAIGFGLSWLVRLVVDHSGLSGVDAAVAEWFADRRTDQVAVVAEAAATVLQGWVLAGAVTVVALLHAVRSRTWHDDLVGVVGTAGAVVPLVVLAVVTAWTGGRAGPDGDPGTGMLSTQTVATAGLCTLAWLLTRGARWPRATAGWTTALVGIVVLANARLYLGGSTASGTVTAVLLGVLWTAIYMIAWSARGAATGERTARVGLAADPADAVHPAEATARAGGAAVATPGAPSGTAATAATAGGGEPPPLISQSPQPPL